MGDKFVKSICGTCEYKAPKINFEEIYTKFYYWWTLLFDMILVDLLQLVKQINKILNWLLLKILKFQNINLKKLQIFINKFIEENHEDILNEQRYQYLKE
ncbi:unnamed protein product [Paramecium sonneborni]|uniref:Uncharacterized protein n=1 Tax=Paramecium sonneborni TaxID=65129 RepID=A0A8S1KU93_9CILI|nr:unnamed protein product [Paramecium sonneborni]